VTLTETEDGKLTGTGSYKNRGETISDVRQSVYSFILLAVSHPVNLISLWSTDGLVG